MMAYVDCPHLAGAAPTDLVVNERIAAARARCEAAGERWTPPRARTYELLLRADGPARAYDLVAGFGPHGGSAKPPTVYRALDFLLELGLAHRLVSRNMFVACAGPGAPHDAQFLICDCCMRAFELDLGAHAIAAAAARERDFVLTRWMAEATGLCPNCHEAWAE